QWGDARKLRTKLLHELRGRGSIPSLAREASLNDLAKVCHSGARVDAIAGPRGVLPNGSKGSPCGIAEFWSTVLRHKPGRCRTYSWVFQARLRCRELSAFRAASS